MFYFINVDKLKKQFTKNGFTKIIYWKKLCQLQKWRLSYAKETTEIHWIWLADIKGAKSSSRLIG